MAVFQQVLWGYELEYPDDWIHRAIEDTEGFAAKAEAFEQDYTGPGSGQVLFRTEWNYARQAAGPLWTEHIGKLAGMLGARQVGSAPWRMGGATGLEAEIVLPKRGNQRLWTGILAYDLIVLHLMVTHPLEDRDWFEPAATRIISSLQFFDKASGVQTDERGLPLPPGFVSIPPTSVLTDIRDSENWRAYSAGLMQGNVSALQAFYLRELPNYGWKIGEYIPFPGQSELGFARLQLERSGQPATLGILPFGEGTFTATSPARVVVKYS
jgi:hypothetical protein